LKPFAHSITGRRPIGCATTFDRYYPSGEPWIVPRRFLTVFEMFGEDFDSVSTEWTRSSHDNFRYHLVDRRI